MVKGELRRLLRGGSNDVAMSDLDWAEIQVRPGEFVATRSPQQLLDPEGLELGDAPGVHLLPSHAVLELSLALQH